MQEETLNHPPWLLQTPEVIESYQTNQYQDFQHIHTYGFKINNQSF